MILVLLGFLGIPIWLVVGVLIATLLSRRSFKRQPGVFDIVVRKENAEKWPRTVNSGRIVSDVLVVNRGAALVNTDVRAITTVSELDIGDGPKRPEHAVGRLVVFTDDTRSEIAVTADVAEQLDAAVG